MAFGPGLHVFPGGAVDAGDATPGSWSGCAAARGDPAGLHGPPFVVAAIREAWEEAGILLGSPGTRGPVDGSWRFPSPAEAGRAPFRELVLALDVVLRGDWLVPLSRWVTPPGARAGTTPGSSSPGCPTAPSSCSTRGEVADHGWLDAARRARRDGRRPDRPVDADEHHAPAAGWPCASRRRRAARRLAGPRRRPLARVVAGAPAGSFEITVGRRRRRPGRSRSDASRRPGAPRRRRSGRPVGRGGRRGPRRRSPRSARRIARGARDARRTRITPRARRRSRSGSTCRLLGPGERGERVSREDADVARSRRRDRSTRAGDVATWRRAVGASAGGDVADAVGLSGVEEDGDIVLGGGRSEAGGHR